GALIVLTSPGRAAALRERMHGEPLLSPQVRADSAAAAQKALAHLPSDMALPAAAGIGVLVCLLARPAKPLPTGRLLFAVTAGAAGVVALTFAVMWELRVGWGADGWTLYRGWFVFRYAAVLVAAFYGYAAADLVRRLRVQAEGPRAVVCAVCVALVAAGLSNGAGRLQDTARTMANRAAAFDAQTARVERAEQAGARTAVVAPLPIEDLAVPFAAPRSGDRIAPWEAEYYGLESVSPAPTPGAQARHANVRPRRQAQSAHKGADRHARARARRHRWCEKARAHRHAPSSTGAVRACGAARSRSTARPAARPSSYGQ
ncbi:hypothetical protein AB0J52_05320, partial [Spirillospora sp. NPDC049652]